MQTYKCKCGKVFEKSSKAETTGYVLNDYSPEHKCYGCPYIVIERDWQTKEIIKRECRATPQITYNTRCKIGTNVGDFSACYLYSLDLKFVQRVFDYVNALEGAAAVHTIPEEWRAADFGQCYSFSDSCYGLGIFPLFFQKNKKGTEARKTVKEKFFDADGYRIDIPKHSEELFVKEQITYSIEKAIREVNRKEENKMGFDISAFISQQEQLKQIDLDMLVTYHNHKFKLYEGERLDDMVNSIKENGVLTPIIVRALDNGKYEILAGHNRCNAARKAGLTSVPGIVKEHLSDEEAEMYVIETNLMQRGFKDLSISEQAAVVALRHSKMFTEAKRDAIAKELSELDNSPVGNEAEKTSKLAATGDEYGLSKNTVARLIRVDKLIAPLKHWIDAKDVSVRAGVELSYISEEAQNAVYSKHKADEVVKLDERTAKEYRELFEGFSGTLNQAKDMLQKLDQGEKPEAVSKPPKPIKISMQPDMFRKYFTEETKPQEIADTIEKALEMYFAASASDSIENVGFTEFTLKKLRELNLLTVSQVKEYVTNNLDAERILDISFEEVISKVCNDEEFADDDDIAVYDFSVHTYNAVKRQRINTVGELMKLLDDVSTAQNVLGLKAYEEIVSKVGNV